LLVVDQNGCGLNYDPEMLRKINYLKQPPVTEQSPKYIKMFIIF